MSGNFLCFSFLQSVDYKSMSKSTCYERYCELAVYLQRVQLLSLSHEERLAFFINVYNALVIHGYLRLGFPKNMWQRYRVRRWIVLVLEAHLKCPILFALEITDYKWKTMISLCSSLTMWATWLEERCSHCRILRMVCCGETGKE